MRFPLCTAGTTLDVTLPAPIQTAGQGHCARRVWCDTGQQGGTETYLGIGSGRVASKEIQGKDASESTTDKCLGGCAKELCKSIGW